MVELRLVELAASGPTLGTFRGGALEILMEELEADVGMFATEGRGGVEREARGFEPATARLLETRTMVYGREIARVQQEALVRGIATDRRTLGAALERTAVYREVMAPMRGTESLFVVASVGGRKLGMVMVGRLGRQFRDGDVARAAQLAPALSVATAAVASLQPSRPTAGVTAAEADLLGYLELGYSSEQIARARGTSFFTVRNQLSALYRKLGVANRTEAVGLRMGRSTHRQT